MNILSVGFSNKKITLTKCLLFAVTVLFVFAAFALNSRVEAAGTNLIQNSSLESQDSSGQPAGWKKGKWGNNSAGFVYLTPGSESSRGGRVNVSNYVSGDAKWYFDDVSVSAGQEYVFTGDYRASVPTAITARFKLSNGTYAYKDLLRLNDFSKTEWRSYETSVVVPSNVVSLTIFHLINSNGFLDIDNQSLLKVVQSDPPTVPGNLIPNPSFESADSNGDPVSWGKGRWGTNTVDFSYPVSGNLSSRAAEVNLSNRVSGDAKWYFAPVPVTGGAMYTFSDDYKSDTTSVITAEYTLSNGAKAYEDIVTLPASAGWTKATHAISVPANAVALTVFHLIKSNGSLVIDNVSLVKKAQPSTFQNGIVTLSFDDGWKSIYQNAIPILNSAGIKSSQYIISGRFEFPAYVNENEVLSMYHDGHEIGSHTVTHPDLTSLSLASAKHEIESSRDTLLSLGIKPIQTFAYPFGAYNSTIKTMVSDAGYIAGRSSDGGLNEKMDTDLYALKRFPVESHTTLAQITAQIDKALAEKKWLILNFHRIDNSGLKYSTRPDMLQSIVNYIKQKNVQTVTVSEGVALTKQ